MKQTTIPTEISTARDQLGRRIPHWHARLESSNCSCVYVTKLIAKRSASLSEEEPPFRRGGGRSTTVNATFIKLVGFIPEPTERTRQSKYCTLTKKRRGEAFGLFFYLVVIWLLLPALALFCHTLSTSYTDVARRKGDEKYLSPQSSFASFFSVPLAQQTVDEEKPHLRRSRTMHTDVQPVAERARHFYSLSSDEPSSQVMFIASERHPNTKADIRRRREVSSRVNTRRLKPHLFLHTHDGTDQTAVYKGPCPSLPHSAGPVSSYFFLKEHVNSSPWQTPALSPAVVPLSQSEQSHRASGVHQAGSPWHAFFQMRNSQTGPFQRDHESSEICSEAEDCKLLGNPARGAHTSHINQILVPTDTAALASPPTPTVAQRDLKRKGVLPPRAPYVSVGFLGVDVDEDEDEDSTAEAAEESEAPKKPRDAVSGKTSGAEDEDEQAGQEDASEKEEEVDAEEEKEKEEEKEAEKEVKGAKGTEGDTGEEEEEEEGTSEHESAKAEEKKHEKGQKEKSPVEAKAKKEGTGKEEAKELSTAHTLIKKKPPEYVPAWATRKGEKTTSGAQKAAEGAAGLITEKPVVTYSSLKPKAKIYFREHHKEEKSKTDGHRETSKKEEKAEESIHKAETAGTSQERSEKPDNEAAHRKKRKNTEEMHEAERTEKEAEDKHKTARETHTEAGEKSGDTKGDHPSKTPPIVLQGQPVPAVPATPGVPGIPLQTQGTAQGALAHTPSPVSPAGVVVPISTAVLPGASTLPTPGAAVPPAVQLAPVPTGVPLAATTTPAGSNTIIPAATPYAAAAAPTGATSPALAAESQSPTLATFPVVNPAGVPVFPPPVSVSPQGDAGAITAAVMQQAATNSAAADEALRQQMQKEILTVAAQKQEAAEEAAAQEWSSGSIALAVVLSLLVVGVVAGLVYYFYDKITRSIQRMRRKYAEALEERKRKRELRRQEEELKAQEPEIFTGDEDASAVGRRGTSTSHSVRRPPAQRDRERR